MKLATFEHDGETGVGVVADGHIVDLTAAGFPPGMAELLDLTGGRIEVPQAALKHELDSVRLLAPLPAPGKLLCLGLNYAAHIAETGRQLPAYPEVFAKLGNTVVGPEAAIVIPRVTSQVDYEAELALVIGRRARCVSEADAMDFVAGYTCFNDVSARDYQNRVKQWLCGKGFDTFGPMGPWIVTADEIEDPHGLRIRSRLNGQTMQDANTSQLLNRIPRLVSYISEVMTLEPGDVISTGTPDGVGYTRDPAVFMKAGDRIEVEIEGIGVLANPVVNG